MTVADTIDIFNEGNADDDDYNEDADDLSYDQDSKGTWFGWNPALCLQCLTAQCSLCLRKMMTFTMIMMGRRRIVMLRVIMNHNS